MKHKTAKLKTTVTMVNSLDNVVEWINKGQAKHEKL